MSQKNFDNCLSFMYRFGMNVPFHLKIMDITVCSGFKRGCEIANRNTIRYNITTIWCSPREAHISMCNEILSMHVLHTNFHLILCSMNTASNVNHLICCTNNMILFFFLASIVSSVFCYRDFFLCGCLFLPHDTVCILFTKKNMNPSDSMRSTDSSENVFTLHSKHFASNRLIKW